MKAQTNGKIPTRKRKKRRRPALAKILQLVWRQILPTWGIHAAEKARASPKSYQQHRDKRTKPGFVDLINLKRPQERRPSGRITSVNNITTTNFESTPAESKCSLSRVLPKKKRVTKTVLRFEIAADTGYEL